LERVQALYLVYEICRFQQYLGFANSWNLQNVGICGIWKSMKLDRFEFEKSEKQVDYVWLKPPLHLLVVGGSEWANCVHPASGHDWLEESSVASNCYHW